MVRKAQFVFPCISHLSPAVQPGSHQPPEIVPLCRNTSVLVIPATYHCLRSPAKNERMDMIIFIDRVFSLLSLIEDYCYIQFNYSNSCAALSMTL